MPTELVTSLFTSAFAALFLFLVWRCGRRNLPVVERHRQWFMPLAAVLYSAVIVWRFNDAHYMISSLYDFLAERVELLSTLNLSVFVVCVFNLAALFAFVLAKAIVLTIVNRTSESGPSSLLKPIYNVAYYYDKNESKWLLRMRYTELRKPLAWMLKAATVIALVLLVASLVFPESVMFVNPFYPAFLPLIIGEVCYFFSGMNAPEYIELMGVDMEEAERVKDFLALQKAAADEFPDRFLESHIRNAKQASAVTDKTYVEKLKSSDCYEERLAGEYVGAVYEAMVAWFDAGRAKREANGDLEDRISLFDDADFKETFKIEIDQVEAMIKMLKGENVIFSSPFYIDFREFFFFPLNRVLMRGKKVLVIDGQGTNGADIRRWVDSGLHAASSVQGLWLSGDLHSHDDSTELDVGILSSFHLNDFAFLNRKRPFLERVGFVVMLHPSQMITTTQIGLARLSHIMGNPDDVTYAAFDVNANGLVDSLSHAARAQFVEVAAMPGLSLLNCGIHWRAEGEEMHLRMFDDVSQYLGLGTEISAFNLRLGVSQIEWDAHEAVPLKDIRWLSNQYFRSVTAYAELEHSQNALEESIILNTNLWSTPVVEEGHFIVEDEICNLHEMQRQYSTRGIVSSFVHVISSNYLMRDFMRYNGRMFLNDARVLSPVVADYQRSLRNYLIELLATLIHQDVDVLEIAGRLRVLGVSVGAGQVFRFCVGSEGRPGKIDDYGLIPDGWSYRCISKVSREVLEEETQERHWHDYLSVQPGEPREELLHLTSYLRYAHYIAEDEVEEDRQLGSCLFGQVQQRFLPGQFMTIQGKFYEILSISPDSGMLLRRAGDHFERRLYYRQVRNVHLDGFKDAVDDMSELYTESLAGVGEAALRKRFFRQDGAEVEIAFMTADVLVRTVGYLRMVDYADLDGSSYVAVSDEEVHPRAYTQKNVLRLTFSNASDSELVTIAALLSELMRTMFAYGYEYLIISPALSEPVADYEELGLLGVVQPLFVEDESQSASCVYVIEDSMLDLGLVSSFERNAERFCAIIQRFLGWHFAMQANGPVLDSENRHFVSPEDIFGDADHFYGKGGERDIALDENAAQPTGRRLEGDDDEGDIEFVEPAEKPEIDGADIGEDDAGAQIGEPGANDSGDALSSQVRGAGSEIENSDRSLVGMNDGLDDEPATDDFADEESISSDADNAEVLQQGRPAADLIGQALSEITSADDEVESEVSELPGEAVSETQGFLTDASDDAILPNESSALDGAQEGR